MVCRLISRLLVHASPMGLPRGGSTSEPALYNPERERMVQVPGALAAAAETRKKLRALSSESSAPALGRVGEGTTDGRPLCLSFSLKNLPFQ